MGVKKQSVNRGTLHRHHPAFCVCFKNVHSDQNYKCTPSPVNVFERGITLPGHSEVSLAVNLLYQLQLCVVLRGSDSNLPDHYCTVFGSSASNLSSHCVCSPTHSTTRVTTYTCYMYCCHNTRIDLQDLKFSFLNNSVTLTRYRPTPWWWSVKIETCRSTFMYFYVF